MEATIGRNSRQEMTNNPDRSKLCGQRGRIVRPSFRKVQVIYYLSRNGQLEHPHYMEVTHLSNQPFRLKDVLDRLTFLRGKGMPSLYSWSCKRGYKNGYVWYDLAENDEIYPSDGVEYVLKGSELLEDAENAQKFQPGSHQPKHKTTSTKINSSQPENITQLYIEEDDENDEEEEYEVKNGYTTSTTPHSRCSIGVSTDELDLPPPPPPPQPPSPPSTTSSSTPSDKASRVFEDGDSVAPTGSLLSRNSVLLQLISCGGSTSFRGTKHVQELGPKTIGATKNVEELVSITRGTKNVQELVPIISRGSTKHDHQELVQMTIGRGNMGCRKSNSSVLHKGVLCKAAAAKEAEEEAAEIMCMSENPRFGSCGVEEREYFSGTIVEEIATEERVQVEQTLKKSSSYNQERRL
ncbi:hypothetical protein Leryth_009260 [Lithospermum erythrorhizon]|nr:hypothetical protein Leryth_009260 [Lithospermum erythrorhizon]